MALFTCWGSRGVVCLTLRLDAVVVVIDLHDGRGRLRAVSCSTGLRRDRRRRLSNEPNAALDFNVGVSFSSHVEDFQAIIVET